jgi:hypothetical protein
VSLNQENIAPAFRNWLQSKEFYTGDISDTIPPDLDNKLMGTGGLLAQIAVKAVFGQFANGSVQFSSARDAENAEAQLAELRNEFDVVGFRTKWSSPILVLGLFSDNLSTSQVQVLFAKTPRQVGDLRNFNLNRRGEKSFLTGSAGALSTKLLLIYTNSEVYEHHCTHLLSDGTVLNQPIATFFRTCFVDMQRKRLQWSPMGGLLSKNKFISSLSDGKELFEKNDLLQVLGYMA